MDNAFWNTLFCENLIEELIAQNVIHFCIAPGSRSSTLSLAAKRHPLAKVITHFDERGLGYLGLGIAKSTKKTVAIIVTSGSALANLLPAVIEAYEDKVPLILLTADRPVEYQQSSANQTIEQYDFFDPFVRFHFHFPAPTAEISESFVKSIVAHATFVSQQDLKGPVHLNCQFRTPLVHPSIKDRSFLKPKTTFESGTRCLSDIQTQQIYKKHLCYEKGVIVVGDEQGLDHRKVLKLAKHLGWPVILDPLSNCRKECNNHYILQNFENILDDLKVDVVLKFGDRFVCKAIEPWICKVHKVVFVSCHPQRSDPEHAVTHRILIHPNQFIHDIIQYTPARLTSTFLKSCFEWSEFGNQSIDLALFKEPLITEIALIRLLSKISIPYNLFVGNSMPIRHVDRVFYPNEFLGEIFANRGHSGIDGNLATAIGIAIQQERPAIALIGDMTFWHDLNSLFFLKKNPIPLIIFVFNNNGGQIFSYLKEFVNLPEKEELFLMPHEVDYQQISFLFGLEYIFFDQDCSLERLLKLKKPVLVELKSDANNDFFHTQQLKTVLEWTIKEKSKIEYK